jgi:hypothetical protein
MATAWEYSGVGCEQPAECTPISPGGDLAIPIFFALSAKLLQPDSGPMTGYLEVIVLNRRLHQLRIVSEMAILRFVETH